MASIAQRRKKYPLSKTSYHILHRHVPNVVIVPIEDIPIEEVSDFYKLRNKEDIIGKNVKVRYNDNKLSKSARCTYECDDFISLRVYKENFKQLTVLKKDIKQIYFKDEDKAEDIPSEKIIKIIDEIFQYIPHDMRSSEKKCWELIKSLDSYKKDFRKKDLSFFIKNKLYENI